MKLSLLRRALFVCVAGSPGLLPAAERISAADFAKSPEITNAQLSPDGQFMAYIFTHEEQGWGWPQLSFLNLATNKATRGARGLGGHYLSALEYTWVSDQRVLCNTAEGGLAAVDRDGQRYDDFANFKRRELGSGLGRIIFASGRDPQRILLENHRWEKRKRVPYPDVVAVDTLTGMAQQELKNPGNVNNWGVDWNGQVRFGLIFDGLKGRLIYRETPGQPWGDLADLGEQAAKLNLAGLDASGRTLYLTRPGPDGRWTLYPYDLQERRMGAPLFQDEDYDILPGDFIPHYAGVPLAGTVFSPRQHALLGVNHVSEGPHQHWFDPALAALQQKIDALNPGLVNFIVSMDREENRLLVLSWSDRDPGYYSLLDLKAATFKLIGRRMPWIKPAQMAPMFPIQCPARDGLTLRGYLTLPPGRGQKDLPMVMLVHGGPQTRDVWGFDPEVQFLANRGYAVLQINYRGSVGFGQDFLDRGKKQVGGAIQDDITDAVRWAIGKGFADPRRIAIMGASYGGYSTLFALAKNPELYRCGVDVAGVSDWPDLFDDAKQESEDYKRAHAYWADRIGDLEDKQERERLARVSPVNFAGQIKAPLMIVHGRDDRTVPLAQAKAMVAALGRAGASPKVLYITNLGHSWPRDEVGADFLNELEKFLAQHLGAN